MEVRINICKGLFIIRKLLSFDLRLLVYLEELKLTLYFLKIRFQEFIKINHILGFVNKEDSKFILRYVEYGPHDIV